ncbi:MAG TPA: hypothetical protein VFA85_02450 [Terriglobales bacterium]|nr:hypothetical protein [Terriglobales bacterium]
MSGTFSPVFQCFVSSISLLVFLTSFGCPMLGCPTLKTVSVQPIDIQTGMSGMAGTYGVSCGRGDIPGVGYGPGPGEVIVGFDDYYNAGTAPLNCQDIRDTDFRAGVRFDLTQFDTVVGANLAFDTLTSYTRSPGANDDDGSCTLNISGKGPETPPESHATTLGLSTKPFPPDNQPYTSGTYPDDPNSEAGLGVPQQGHFNFSVTRQVSGWVLNPASNFGFVIWGPCPPRDASHYNMNNNAQTSTYGKFVMNVTYDPSKNPRAPQ